MDAFKIYASPMTNFENSENISNKVLCLPLFASIKEREVKYVIKKVTEFFC